MLLLLLVVNYFVGSYLAPDAPARLEVPYTLFRQQVDRRQRGRDRQPRRRHPGHVQAGRHLPAGGRPGPHEHDSSARSGRPSPIPAWRAELFEQGVVINARPLEEPRGWLLTLLISFGPAILLIGVFIWLSRRAASQLGGMGGAFGLGRSTARRVDKPAEDEKRVTFEDVAGIEEAEQRAGRDRRLPQEPAEVHPPRRHRPEGRPAGRLARDRARRCWPGPWPARPACRSSAWAPPSSSR